MKIRAGRLSVNSVFPVRSFDAIALGRLLKKAVPSGAFMVKQPTPHPPRSGWLSSVDVNWVSDLPLAKLKADIQAVLDPMEAFDLVPSRISSIIIAGATNVENGCRYYMAPIYWDNEDFVKFVTEAKSLFD